MADLECAVPNQSHQFSFLTSDLTVPFRDPQHTLALDYWWSLADGDLPLFTRFSPAGLGAGLLANIAFVESNDRDGFRFRVWGTELVYMFNTEMTGRDVHEFPFSQCQTHFIELFRMITKERQPVYVDSQFCYPDRSFVRSEKTAFPLVDERLRICRILMLQTFDTRNAKQDRVVGNAAPSDLIHSLEPFSLDDSRSFGSAGDTVKQHLRID